MLHLCLPEHRRRGHVRALIRWLEDEARQLGYQELYLKTEYSRNFYEQLVGKFLR
ncbi:GNAT family N-acetyltransferase [Nitrosospira multiformis]|uniref:GNAT family N-acetyltransferase n=1 Tax=Nitrosospira multiformis TaxID=1231 RepID=UPI0035233895